ncbi:MAG: hypothetical protein COB07_12930 [Sulfurovum sp.]|nr:MAG: hypothetical protein COB07_12930 [Sulfurovum sp.]
MRLEGIDLLRGMAVSAVIIYHFFVILGLINSPIFPYIHSFGLFGVSLFFVISGYLIYRSVDYSISSRGIKIGLKNYMSHRLFRILPAYYFNFAIVFIMATFIIASDYLYSFSFFKQVLSHLTFFSYFIYKDAGLGINGAYWTLSIEMLWYMVAPLLFIYIKKDRYLVLLFIMSLLYLLGLDLSFYDIIFDLKKNTSHYILELFYLSFQLPGQLIYFLAGIFIYKYLYKQISISATSKYIYSIFIIVLFIYITSQYNINKSFLVNNLFILFTVATLFILLYHSKPKWMRTLEWIGKISYSLYLWHMPILFVMNKSHILEYLSLFEAAVFFLILLFSISTMSYYFIEEGGFNLRKKLEEKIKKRATACEGKL